MEGILQFLKDLEENNSLEWMRQNKMRYIDAQNDFIDLVQKLISQIILFDNSIAHLQARDLIFRLNRDTRFSKDKSPYNPAFRAHISAAGKVPIPVGYYVSIRPGNRSFLGGGLFTPMFRDATTMMRDYLNEHGARFETIVTAEEFRKHFIVMGESLKNVPAGYDPVHPQGAYLKNKSWYLEYPLSDSQLIDTDGFIGDAEKIFTLMQPFNNFLNDGLKGFRMPERK